MRFLRILLRLVGWLLTPFIAWAASFLGASLGALIATGMDSPRTGLIITVTLGAVTGFGTLAFVIHLLRRLPRLRQALHVTEDAMPDTSELAAAIESGESPEGGAP